MPNRAPSRRDVRAPAEPLKDFEVLRDVEGVRALSDPVRLAMIKMLTRSPQSGSGLARALEIPANRAHYHLKRLLDAGLIRDVGGGRGGQTEERYFEATARHILVDPGLGADEDRTTAVLRQSIDVTFADWRRTQVLAIGWNDLAKIIVHRSLRVTRDDRVLVFFAPITLEAAENVLMEVEKCGAEAHLRTWSRTVILGTLDRYLPEELDALPLIPPGLDERITSVVFLTSSLPQGAPPTPEQQVRLPHLLRTVSAWKDSVRKRGLRYLHVGLPHRGEFAPGYLGPEAGIDTFWRCLTVDGAEIEARGRPLLEAVRRHPEVVIEGPDTTRLSVTLDLAHTAVSDGVISAERARTGQSVGELPAGAFGALPVEGSGDGAFRADYTFVAGRHYRDVLVVLRAGRIVELDGPEGVDVIRERLAREVGDPDLLSGVSIGLNPGGTGPTGRPELDTLLAGVVTLGFGNNELAGGTVRSTFNLGLPAHGRSVRSGATPLVVRGILASGGGGEPA